MPAPLGNKNRLGIKHTDEVKKRISETLKGRKPWNTGQSPSEETRRKISLALKGRVFSEETRRKLSEAAKKWKRPVFSKEWIDNLKKARAKRVYTNEMRKKMSDAQKRVVAEGRCHLWRGGVSEENRRIRDSLEYKLWRESVFKRDCHKCVLCGKGNKDGERTPLQADHIKPFCDYPELRLDINNGRTLCIPCHKKTDTYCRKSKKNLCETTV